MVATRGRTFKRPWRRSCHSSKLKSSSAPIGRKDSWCFHAVGSSNAPLLGSTAAEGLQRIGRTSIATRWRSCGSPQSASCSENFVIPPDVFGQTLREAASNGPWLSRTCRGGWPDQLGVDLRWCFYRGAYFVDRILRGTPPGELPIEFPKQTFLSINLRTEKALGITIEPMLLARADEVIE